MSEGPRAPRGAAPRQGGEGAGVLIDRPTLINLGARGGLSGLKGWLWGGCDLQQPHLINPGFSRVGVLKGGCGGLFLTSRENQNDHPA